jgi:probable phosphoglycerate mutase
MDYPPIILVRHGETLWNREGRYQGRLNSPLTQKGVQQAKSNAKKIKSKIEEFSDIKIFSSPLGRAKDTAYIICDEIGVDREKIIFDNRVIEFDYGIFEGQKKEDVVKLKEFRDREANKWDYKIENGESYDLVQRRVKSFLDDIKDEKLIIVVAHEMVNRTIRGLYCNYTKNETLKLRQPNSVVLYLEDGSEREF